MTTRPAPSPLDELEAARLRDAGPEALLELAEDAIDRTAAGGDTRTLESIATELESAARAHPDEDDGLRLQFAAERAHVIAAKPPPAASAEEVPVPTAAKAAFSVTVAILVLTPLLLAMMGAGSYGIAYLFMFLVALGSLLAAVTGIVGLVQSVQAGSRKGVLMSLVPCASVLFLIGLRIWVSL